VGDHWPEDTPSTRPSGIETVVLNGLVVVEQGRFDRRVRAGVVLRSQ
jgi:hypothetical protein